MFLDSTYYKVNGKNLFNKDLPYSRDNGYYSGGVWNEGNDWAETHFIDVRNINQIAVTDNYVVDKGLEKL